MRFAVALPVLAFALLAVLLCPVATAGSPTGTVTTHISLVLPPSATVDRDATLMGVLHNSSSNQGIPGATLTFSIRTTFGWLVLGNVTTNGDGKAALDWRPKESGTSTVLVSYEGDGTYAPVNATGDLAVQPAGPAPPPGLSSDTIIVLIILAAVGGVWATYGFVAWQVVGIRADAPERARAVRGSRSKSGVKGSMAEEAEASRSAKAAPSGTSRAALGVAIAALVLAGIGIATAASGAFAPRAPAYTPTTVNLQMTVVPDLQGSGWDVFVPDELVVHAGDTVVLTVYNADTVEHGLHIAEFNVDHDLPAAVEDNVTGITPSKTVVTFTADHAGTFGIDCNVVCGPGHDEMAATLEVLPA